MAEGNLNSWLEKNWLLFGNSQYIMKVSMVRHPHLGRDWPPPITILAIEEQLLAERH
jgi:hypothetical protein